MCLGVKAQPRAVASICPAPNAPASTQRELSAFGTDGGVQDVQTAVSALPPGETAPEGQAAQVLPADTPWPAGHDTANKKDEGARAPAGDKRE